MSGGRGRESGVDAAVALNDGKNGERKLASLFLLLSRRLARLRVGAREERDTAYLIVLHCYEAKRKVTARGEEGKKRKRKREKSGASRRVSVFFFLPRLTLSVVVDFLPPLSNQSPE